MKKIREAYNPKPYWLKILKESQKKVYPNVDYLKKWYLNYSTNHLNRLSFDLQYLSDEFPIPKGVKVLEMGSVPPLLTVAIKELGYDVTGFDVDPSRFKNCIENNSLNIIEGKIGEEKLPFVDQTFEVIIMNEVFEHLNTNLIEVINEIKRILKPEGKLFISTPNLKSLVGIRNFLIKGKAYSCCGELYEEYHKIEKYGHMGHVREYTPTEVILFLKELNMKVEKLIFRGKYPIKYRIAEIIFPSLKPFFSIVAVKK